MLLDWKPVSKSSKLVEEILPTWIPPLMGNIKLNFDGCSSGNSRQLGIGETFRDHHVTLVSAFYNSARVGLAVEAKILALLEGLELAMD